MKKIYFGLILLSTMAFNTSVLADDNQPTTQTTTTEESILVESSTETTTTKELVTSESSSLKETTQTETSEAKKMDVTPKAEITNRAATKETIPAQGPYITDGSYVKITKKNYEIWQNFNWKKKDDTTNHYGKVYLAKGRYEHKNGQTYYSLFNNKDQWVGYLNANATTKTVAQGPYIADGTYVKFKKRNYPARQNFNWKQKQSGSDIVEDLYQAKGRYEHFNGSTYYSMYDSKGVWQGYANANAVVKTSKKEGPYIADGREVTITKKNYDIWQNFNWKNKSNTNKYYGQKMTARGRYYHFNGERYYSLYDNKGTWIGYLNSKATTVVTGENGSRPTTIDELEKGYSSNDETYDYWVHFAGNTGLSFANETDFEKYFHKYYRTGNNLNVKLKDTGERRMSMEAGGAKSFFPNENYQ
ncbi:hypothetical protein [Vagococcus hydrophili]|uniref:Uncharacterized protein n=1 Tax=Vagococcus hydrophili TaxID=2714947 RepID=A0A6G8AQZ3_9ENTE|nr:hypothetical protein [Vagococcus hydrophili]QIL47389.1 hypothetical protein G7082_02000 [Vagococcus hydrophili]